MAQGIFNKGNIIEGNARLSIAAGSRYAIYDAFGLDGLYLQNLLFTFGNKWNDGKYDEHA